MGRKQKVPFSVLENVTIGPAVAEGNCIVRDDNKVVFVRYAAPGDIGDVKIIGKKKKYLEGKLIKINTPSSLRIPAFCKHFGTCGGCKWQHLSYSEQLKFKQQQAIDAIERIGKQKDFEVEPILGSKKQTFYRNKLEFTFSNKAWIQHFDPENPKPENALGFHIPGRFDKVLDVEECYLMPDPANQIRTWIKNYTQENGLTYFDLNAQEGLLRNVMIRCNKNGEWMVIFSFHTNDESTIHHLLHALSESFPQIIQIGYAINSKRNDSWSGLEIITFKGPGYLTEELGGLTFKIRPQSFFQTNSHQAEELYKITKEYAALTGKERVYDLYTGTGSIALYVANQAAEVIGIEYVEEAIKDAKENMEANGINHCKFFAGDMKDILNDDFILQHGKPDVIITDPPRDGMHPAVVECILKTEAQKLVYVSCNPATQARDIELLSTKYKLVKMRPVDMFPHTHHLENVALLQLR